MPTTKVMLDDAELAKNYIINSDLSDEYKRTYLRLLNISTMATNGITPEQKIQKMTECIQLLVVTQAMYILNIDKKIESSIEKSTKHTNCENCKAMQFVNNAEQEQHDKELIANYVQKSHININEHYNTIDTEKLTWPNILKTILLKPYIYVVLCLMFISPYSVEIVKTICQFATSK